MQRQCLRITGSLICVLRVGSTCLCRQIVQSVVVRRVSISDFSVGSPSIRTNKHAIGTRCKGKIKSTVLTDMCKYIAVFTCRPRYL